MTFRASVLTLYPDMFPGPVGASLAGRALEDGIWSLETRNIRDFATDKHRSVDDTPAGGGAGMVLRPDVLAAAIDSVADDRPMLALTPRGAPLTQARVRELVAGEGVILLCGRFEGFDERIFEASQQCAQAGLPAGVRDEVSRDADEVGSTLRDPSDGALARPVSTGERRAEMEVGEMPDAKTVEWLRKPVDRYFEDAVPEPARLDPAVGGSPSEGRQNNHEGYGHPGTLETRVVNLLRSVHGGGP